MVVGRTVVVVRRVEDRRDGFVGVGFCGTTGLWRVVVEAELDVGRGTAVVVGIGSPGSGAFGGIVVVVDTVAWMSSMGGSGRGLGRSVTAGGVTGDSTRSTTMRRVC